MKLFGPLLLCCLVAYICAYPPCKPMPEGPVTILETDGPERGPLFTFIAYKIRIYARAASDHIMNNFNENFVRKTQGSVMTIELARPVYLNAVKDLFNGDVGLELEISVLCQEKEFGEEVKLFVSVFVRPNPEMERKNKKFIYRGLENFIVNEETEVGEELLNIGGLITTSDSTRYYDIQTYIATVYVKEWPDALKKFRIEKDGRVFLIAPLDYRGGDREFMFNMTVIGDYDRTASNIIYFEVDNVDNNSPGFDYSGCVEGCKTTHYSAEISGTHVGLIKTFEIGPVKAVDYDYEPFLYEIVGGSPKQYQDYVGINSSTGALWLLKPVASLQQGVIDMVIQVNAIGDLPPAKQPVRKRAYTICMLWVSGFKVDYSLKSQVNSAAQLQPSLLSLAAEFACVLALSSRIRPLF